ncbi:hypothetical protein HGP14_09420 [Rhizobium sp. P32RR-XVIII]|uniref:PD-(D/E)XK nuclease-like domain-containing protein n=1 Tax=Rhizobium sp. P32RR-XVIII TaxID=2726738 RepID=UPI0014574994|nr:PD-(D/E)XK nuclease-like domain-containing protein [Rhizobium sp. P32RR-XVIII]NLS03576.1 hypothetical protein [Rhizobium sp. P32RR-XVIII]
MADTVTVNTHVEALKEQSKFIPDGIYFGMPESVYHGDPALGSTGIKKLVDNAPDYWWDSPLNPARPEDDDTPAKVFGRQFHQCVLEGPEKFKAGHAPQYNPGNRKDGIDEIAKIKEAGKVPVKFKDYAKILAASAFIKANKTLANAFEGGVPEVSVFWTENGIRYKVRFDYLKMNAITDLKSLANMYGKEFGKACRDAVAGYDYIVSAEHYRHGRMQMARLIKEGKVYNAPDDPKFMPWLIQIAGNGQFAFVFVFYQKDGAPISHAIMLSPGNPLFGYARQMIVKAIDNYNRYMAEFGTDTAWVPSTPLEELDETDLPVWYQQRLTTGA